MAKCMEKCCESKECDVAYMVEKKCYSVSCSSRDDCKPVTVKASKKTPLISAMIMKAEPKEETGRVYLLNALRLGLLMHPVFFFWIFKYNRIYRRLKWTLPSGTLFWRSLLFVTVHKFGYSKESYKAVLFFEIFQFNPVEGNSWITFESVKEILN